MSCIICSSLFIRLCIGASCSSRNWPQLGEDSARKCRGNLPFRNTSLLVRRGRGVAAGWWRWWTVGVCMASLLATALGMGTLFSMVQRCCKRRRKKRSEHKGSALIAVQLKQSTGGGHKRRYFQVRFEPSLLSVFCLDL